MKVLTKKMLLLCCALVCLIFAFSFSACEQKVTDGLEFKLNEDNSSYCVSGIGTATDKDIVIPSTYDGKPVTNIGWYAFRDNKSITSVTIPASVQDIGLSAFYGCTALKSVEIEDGVKHISDYAFKYCSALKEVEIPASVTGIASEVFDGCDKLIEIRGGARYVDEWVVGCESETVTSVTLDKDTQGIANGSLYGCTALTAINFGGTKEQWNALYKGRSWNTDTGAYTVHCSDGDVAKK